MADWGTPAGGDDWGTATTNNQGADTWGESGNGSAGDGWGGEAQGNDAPVQKKWDSEAAAAGRSGWGDGAGPDMGGSGAPGGAPRGPFVERAPTLQFNFHMFGVEIPEIEDPADAWEGMREASIKTAVEIFHFKKFLAAYAKSMKEAEKSWDLAEVEEGLRKMDAGVYLIALDREWTGHHRPLAINGEPKYTKYTLALHYGPDPPSAKLARMWPSSQEENLEKLKDCGLTTATGLPCCDNCRNVGHWSRECPQGVEERVPFVQHCVNCDQDGHWARDCPEERKKPGKKGGTCRICEEEGHMARDCPNKESGGGGGGACRKCGEEGHFARDCTQEGAGGGGACRKCGEEGHFARECPTGGDMAPKACRNCDSTEHVARDCPEPKNMARVKCNNCDEMGHVARECPQPRDWSRVKCSNCGEMGHTHVRCKAPKKEEDNGGWGASGETVMPSIEGLSVADAGGDSWGTGGGHDSWGTSAGQEASGGW